jgi:ATP-binding cassette, subfamily B, bacterial MsbA
MSTDRDDGTASAWPIYRRLLKYVAPYRAAFLFAFFAMAADASLDATIAMLMQPLMENGFVSRDVTITRILVPVLLGIFLLRGLASLSYGYLMAWIGRRVIHALRSELFGRYLVLPTRAFDASTGGSMLSKITFDIEQISASASNAITFLVRDSLKVIALMGVMLYHSWQLSIVIMVVGPTIAALVGYVSRLFRKHSRSIQDSMGDVTRVAEEAIDGHRVVKVFGGEAYEQQRFLQVNDDNRRSNMRLEFARAGSDAIVQWIAGVGITIIIYFAVAHSDLSTGDFTAFLSAMLLLMGPLKRLTNINAPLQKGIAAARSVFEVLDREPEDRGGGRSIGRATGELAFQDVSFCYAEDKGDVLQDISFQIPAGTTVALVGRSGSGKSTLVSLIPRLYDVERGKILLDGAPLREYALEDLRRQIALVSQEVVLFNDTIAANIAYGSLANVPREAVERAAEQAFVDEFTQRLPQGMDTVVGDRGVLLSGGQRQRIAIARALLKDAPILILDEATSALDTESERRIQQALGVLMEGRTTLVIAHRLSTVEGADRVLVLRDGAVVEAGGHAELIARDGEYAALHRLQFQTDV